MTLDKNISSIMDRGINAFINNDFADSISCFTQSINEFPEYAPAYVSRGAAYLKSGKADASISDFEKALKLNPGHARAHHMCGLAHEMRGDLNKALNCFDTAIGLSPSYGAAYRSRASLYSKLDRPDEATEDIRMLTLLSGVQVESFANENNIWRSHHLKLQALEEKGEVAFSGDSFD